MSTLVEAAPQPNRLGVHAELPRRWFWLMRLFRRYAHRYVRKHFHGVRLSRSGSAFPPRGDEPVLVVLNHPSWWDPMICIVLSSLMRERDQFAAIDAAAVERYAFFKKLGFVGVDTKSLRGAAEFLRTGTMILSQPNRVFWVTAQGRFTDVRERPLAVAGGCGPSRGATHLWNRVAGRPRIHVLDGTNAGSARPRRRTFSCRGSQRIIG